MAHDTTASGAQATLAAIWVRRAELHRRLAAAEATGDLAATEQLRELWVRLEAVRIRAEAAATPLRHAHARPPIRPALRLGTGEFAAYV
jgi:hypothetical protein